MPKSLPLCQNVANALYAFTVTLSTVWLGSSVVRVLARYARDPGFESRSGHLLFPPLRKILHTWPGRGLNPDHPGWKSDTLPRRHKSRRVQQGCSSVVIHLYPMIFSPTKFGFVSEVPGHRERFLIRLGELLHGGIGWFYVGIHCHGYGWIRILYV